METAEKVIGLVIGLLLLAYLVVALIKAEDF
jgi:K+-transporting ATPase KdpF subunit